MSDADPWHLLRIRTAGLLATVNLGQAYDHSKACPTCGAGAKPVPPLLADLARMGKKPLDHSAHDGQLVTTRELVDAMIGAGLTGFVARSVTRRSSVLPDARFAWLDVTVEWPRLEPSSRVTIEDLCPRCQRGGHFDVLHGGETQLVYDRVPPDAADLNATWEYFGSWRPPAAMARKVPVGGARYVIVSERARQLFVQRRVRWLDFEPVILMRLE
jgi:hypothetical protein